MKVGICCFIFDGTSCYPIYNESIDKPVSSQDLSQQNILNLTTLPIVINLLLNIKCIDSCIVELIYTTIISNICT